MVVPQKSSTIIFFVNGKKVEDDNVDPEWTLLHYLRTKLQLTGTKLGCAEGGCGACTVMVSKYDRTSNRLVHMSVNACLAHVCSMHGLSVTTVEGIGSTRSRIHPVQERIAKAHGSQCGFCTPGIVMSMYSLLRSLPGKPTMADLETAFQGNLCRCTGYRPIIEGYKTFTEEWEQHQAANGLQNGGCPMGEKCCKNSKQNGEGCSQVNGSENGYTNGSDIVEDSLFNPREFVPYDPSQEPIFPPELKVSDTLDNQYLVVQGPRVTWYRPTNLSELLELKAKYPAAKIVNGNTEIGVEVKFKNCLYPVLIQPSLVMEMSEMRQSDSGLWVGASVTLSNLETTLRGHITDLPEYKTRVFQAIVEMLHWFAGKQIRNVAAVGGNIMTGSPISDLNPIFMAAGCELELVSQGGKRVVQLNSSFWTGYRRNIVKPEEILLAIHIPFTTENQYFAAYKQAKRREDDIAVVNAAFNLQLTSQSHVVDMEMAFGGMAPTTVSAPNTAAALKDKPWTSATIEAAFSTLMTELSLDPGAPGGLVSYRCSLTLSLLFKFYLKVTQKLESKNVAVEKLPDSYKSAINGFESVHPKSSQYFQLVPSTQSKTDLVGRPIVHRSAFKQATGEAIYCDDMPLWQDQVYLALVFSSRAHAKILSIDPSAALALPGVHAFYCSDDLPAKNNHFGPIAKDDFVFADKEVMCVGQVVGAVVADTQQLAQRAAKLVKVEYEDLQPVIITIEDAIRENSYFSPAPMKLRYGDVDAAFATADHILEGEVRLGAQEQFYLETQACIVIPKGEDDEMEIISSTQHPTEIQGEVANMLGVTSNKIVVKVKRIGGGFGGKESRSSMIALPCALAATKLGKPVRCMLDRDEDMISTGQRHPFLGRYKVAFTSQGKITACEIKLYCNAGMSYDLSMAVMGRAMMHFQNAYHIPNVMVYGYVCKTNLVTNTAFRGFGGPQGMFIGETMMRQVAAYLNKDPFQICSLNLYKEGDRTHYTQELKYCTLDRCWSEVVNDSDYNRRKAEVEKFNKENRWKKRGIAVVPTMFGVAYTEQFLNQSGALVMIYTDGSVLLSHGGMEMGQGLHTKMIQVASRALGIPASLIHISETSTDKVPNTGATAASSGSDLNGMAIIDACNKLNERLKPYKAAKPEGQWKDWVLSAWFDRVSLAATGFYSTPDIKYDFEKNEGLAFNYMAYGAGVSEVEIDCLTGDHIVLRTDLVMDVGESLNPAIDVGQVEGAFMQGYGLFTIEETVHSPQGALLSRGPGAYKIPGFGDIPAEFNVALLKGAPNPRAVYSSKAVGEPPLFLASSVFFAIREAVAAARAEVGFQGYFRLDSPATAARIRMSCADHIAQKFPDAPEGKYKPWNVIL
ncbi:xanthine dehydrogenase-like [Macrosteles quadrilineatus]|uniref:xanthine dehydrogenase-like n=1 Tax=Macrosteles quadrilineatus TaxID=74068 RepID=UPI0023E0A675|nr:xanthine dehydrogenase-like [Macrosteles quadrilineatus]